MQSNKVGWVLGMVVLAGLLTLATMDYTSTKIENSYLRMTLAVEQDRIKVLQETIQVLENGVNTQQAQFNELARQCGRR